MTQKSEVIESPEGYFHHESSYIDQPCKIGRGTKIWHFTHVMADCEIGERCNIGQNVVISNGVKLGTNVKVQNNVSLYSGVTCEDDVFLGPSAVFTNIKTPRSHVVRRNLYKNTLLKKGATLGANSTVICGITIGEYCLLAAGSVLTKNTKPYSLMVGNPARHLGWVCECGEVVFHGQPCAVTETRKHSCPGCQSKYIERNGALERD